MVLRALTFSRRISASADQILRTVFANIFRSFPKDNSFFIPESQPQPEVKTLWRCVYFPQIAKIREKVFRGGQKQRFLRKKLRLPNLKT